MIRLLKPQRGIAIAPILMIIALLAVIVGAFSRGADMLGGAAINSDRIVYDLRGQIDMIRAKVEECVMVTRQQGMPQFLFPGFDQLDMPIRVMDLECPRDSTGQRNLWQGARPAALPSEPRGFQPWLYINHGDPEEVSPGGICIMIKPTPESAAQDMYRDAIRKALRRYSNTEVKYDYNDPEQRIIIWLRRPVIGDVC